MDEIFEKNSLVSCFFIFQNSLLRICGMCYEVVSVICSNTYTEWQNEEFSLLFFFFQKHCIHRVIKYPFENISALNATTGNEIENLMRISEIDKSLNYFPRSFFHFYSHSFSLACTMSHLRVVEIVSNAILSSTLPPPPLQIGFS